MRNERRLPVDLVVGYLEENRWTLWNYPDRRCYVRMDWSSWEGYHWADEVPNPRAPGRRLSDVIARIAAIEGRSSADVRRDIEGRGRKRRR